MTFTVVVRTYDSPPSDGHSDKAHHHDTYVQALRHYRELTRPHPAQPPRGVMLTTLGCNADLNELDDEQECVIRASYNRTYISQRRASAHLTAQVDTSLLRHWQNAKYRALELGGGLRGDLSGEDREALGLLIDAVELMQDALHETLPFGLVFPDAATGHGPDLDARLSPEEQRELLATDASTLQAPRLRWQQVRGGEVIGWIGNEQRYRIHRCTLTRTRFSYSLTDLRAGMVLRHHPRQRVLKAEAQESLDRAWSGAALTG